MSERRWTAEQVVAMRDRYRAGDTMPELARSFGGCLETIKRALFGVTYADVPGWLTVAERRARRSPGPRAAPIFGSGMWAWAP